MVARGKIRRQRLRLAAMPNTAIRIAQHGDNDVQRIRRCDLHARSYYVHYCLLSSSCASHNRELPGRGAPSQSVVSASPPKSGNAGCWLSFAPSPQNVVQNHTPAPEPVRSFRILRNTTLTRRTQLRRGQRRVHVRGRRRGRCSLAHIQTNNGRYHPQRYAGPGTRERVLIHSQRPMFASDSRHPTRREYSASWALSRSQVVRTRMQLVRRTSLTLLQRNTSS